MLNANQFKFHLARYAKVSEADAAAFVDALTQTLLDQVKAGEEVTIQGLGTFSVIATQQGRRLAFQVDERMRAAVNAPFACFEPVVVSNAPRPIGDDIKPEEVAADDVPAKPVEEAENVVADVPDEAPSAAPEPENRVAEPIAADAPSASVEPSPDAPSEPAEQEPESASQTDENRVAETSAAIGGIVAAISASAEKKTQLAEEKKPETPQPQRRRRYEEPDTFEVLKAKLQLVKPWMWGAAAGVLAVVVVLIFAVKSCSSPSAEKFAETKPAAEAVVDSASAETESAVEAETPTAASEKPTQIETESASATKSETHHEAKPSVASTKKVVGKPSDEMLLMEGGKPKMATLGDGGRLTLVALREYGDKAFWAYIYDVNAFQLGDPNNVPIGLPLYLPNPSYFRIDASDVKSVKRAQNRAMQILNAAK